MPRFFDQLIKTSVCHQHNDITQYFISMESIEIKINEVAER